MAADADALARARSLLGDERPLQRGLVTALFERESPVDHAALELAVGEAGLAALVDLDLVRIADGRCEPVARVDRVGRLLVASDLRLRRREADFVVGPGPASFLLARYVTVGAPARALDLGCGSGILSLILAAGGAAVDGLDINPRALAFARFNAALNGLPAITVGIGDFLAGTPDRRLDGRFDVVVANPPFVLAPTRRLVYRDRPLPGDETGARTVERVARSLAPGGRGYVLCNWIDRGDPAWSDGARRWIRRTGADALIVHVGDHAPADYAAAWNRDVEAPARGAAIAEWTDALTREGVRRVQAGVIALRRPSMPGMRRPRFQAVERDDRAITSATVAEFLDPD